MLSRAIKAGRLSECREVGTVVDRTRIVDFRLHVAVVQVDSGGIQVIYQPHISNKYLVGREKG